MDSETLCLIGLEECKKGWARYCFSRDAGCIATRRVGAVMTTTPTPVTDYVDTDGYRRLMSHDDESHNSEHSYHKGPSDLADCIAAYIRLGNGSSYSDSNTTPIA